MFHKIDCYNEVARAWQLLWDVITQAVKNDTLYTLKPHEKRGEVSVQGGGCP